MPQPFDPNALIQAGPSNPAALQTEEGKLPTGPVKGGDEELSLDEFDNAKQGIKTVTTSNDSQAKLEVEERLALEKLEASKKAEEEAAKKAATEVKEEVKVIPKDDTQPKLPPTAKLPVETKPQGPLSDDDLKSLGIAETAIPLYRKMARETQEHVVAEFRRRGKEIDGLKGELEAAKKNVREGLPSAWYEHEGAYTLLPEYQKLEGEAHTTQSYVNHFRQQLIAIKEGEKWVDLTVGADGKLQQIVSEPGAHAEVSVMEKIRSLDNIILQKQQAATRLAVNFQNQSKNLRSEVQEIENYFFPQYEKEFEKNPHRENAMKALAVKGQHTNPLANFVAKFYAAWIDENTARVAAEEKLAQYERRPKGNGPTGEEIDKGEIQGDKKIVLKVEDQPYDDSEFEAVIKRGHS